MYARADPLPDQMLIIDTAVVPNDGGEQLVGISAAVGDSTTILLPAASLQKFV